MGSKIALIGLILVAAGLAVMAAFDSSIRILIFGVGGGNLGSRGFTGNFTFPGGGNFTRPTGGFPGGTGTSVITSTLLGTITGFGVAVAGLVLSFIGVLTKR